MTSAIPSKLPPEVISDRIWLDLCLKMATFSKDPSTQVGAVVISRSPRLRVIGCGYNGFPDGIAETPERMNDRDTKLKLIVHAELAATLAAASVGCPTNGCTLYLAATDASGEIWGGCPCTRCTVELIAAGIKEVVSFPWKRGPSRWEADIRAARELLTEAAVKYREVAPWGPNEIFVA